MVLSKKEMGEKIKAARKVKADFLGGRYTQEMLADDLEISRGYLGDIEAGRTYPNYVLLSKIATFCGVTLNFFEENSNDKKINQVKEQSAFYEYTENPTHKILLNSEEESIILRFRKLPPISQQTVLSLINSLEIIDKAQNEKASSKSEVS